MQHQPSPDPAALPAPPGSAALPRQVQAPLRAQTAGDHHYAARVPAPVEELLFEVKRLIVGQDRLLERLLVALLSGGHVLLEGVPGLAKTVTVKAFAQEIGRASCRERV